MIRKSWLVALCLAGALSGGTPAAAQPPEAVPPDAAVETAPVEVDGVELFSVRGVTTYPAARRAADIAARIVRVAEDPGVAPEQLAMVEGDLGTEIRGGATRIMVVTDADADLEGIDRKQLAATVVVRVQQSLRSFRLERGRESLLAAGRRAGLALALLLAAAIVLRWLDRRVYGAIERQFDRRVKSVAIGSFEFVRVDRMRTYLSGLHRAVRTLAALGLSFAFLSYTLQQFPWTRSFGNHLDEWVIGPLQVLGGGLVGIVPNLFFLAILWFLAKWTLRLVRLFFEGVGRGDVELSGFDPAWAEPTYKIVRLALVVLAIVVAYPYIPGSDTEAFKGISLFLGLVFSLGSSGAIANIIAGYTLTYRRPFREGDRVKIGDVVGAVSRVRLQVTHIRTPKNEDVVIPNSSILNSEVINYSTLAASDGLILHTTVGIGYETPWRQVEAMLLLAAERTPGLAPGRQAFVLQRSLGDFAVTYELNVHLADPTRILPAYSDLHRSILDVFNEYGIQIMTPAYEGDPEQPKIVPREQWFTAPATPAPESPARS